MRSLFALVLVTACAEPAIEMKLVMPNDSAPFDMSCVTAVDLLPIPVGDTKPIDIGERQFVTMDVAPCVDLARAPTSFADVQTLIRGKFEMALPAAGLAGVEIRGRAGVCGSTDTAGGYHEAMFYGGATYHDGQDTLAIPIAHNISCDAATTYNVRPVDLPALVATKACADVADAGDLFAANVRPTLLDGFEPVEFEAGTSFHALKAGVATVGSFNSTWAGSCAAVGWDGANGYSSMCIPTANPAAMPQACAKAGEIDFPIVAGEWVQNALDSKLLATYLAPVIGDVWTTTAPAGPLSGATVTLDANSDAQVVYGDITATTFTPAAGATATGASGGFIIYTNQVVGVTIAAPGKAPRHVWVGGGGELPAASLTVLN